MCCLPIVKFHFSGSMPVKSDNSHGNLLFTFDILQSNFNFYFCMKIKILNSLIQQNRYMFQLVDKEHTQGYLTLVINSNFGRFELG